MGFSCTATWNCGAWLFGSVVMLTFSVGAGRHFFRVSEDVPMRQMHVFGPAVEDVGYQSFHGVHCHTLISWLMSLEVRILGFK